MSLKLLPNQWSIKFPKCFLCGTSRKKGRFKHECKGLCHYCYKKIEGKNYWKKVKDDPIKKKEYQEHCRAWRKTSPVFKAYLRRRGKMVRYAKFIREWFENSDKKLQKRHQGIVIHFEHNDKIYKVTTPLLNITKHKVELKYFRDELQKYLDKNRMGV